MLTDRRKGWGGAGLYGQSLLLQLCQPGEEFCPFGIFSFSFGNNQSPYEDVRMSCGELLIESWDLSSGAVLENGLGTFPNFIFLILMRNVLWIDYFCSNSCLTTSCSESLSFWLRHNNVFFISLTCSSM